MGSKAVALKSKVGRVQRFLLDDMWISDVEQMNFLHRCLIQLSKIFFTTVRGFQRDGCTLHASALTYITLVTLVPMLAIMFSFTKSFGMQRRLFEAVGVERVEVIEENEAAGISGTSEIRLKLDEEGKPDEDSLMGQLPESMQELSLQVLRYVDRTNFAALGIVGTLLLVLGVIFSISKLEICFNIIWGVDKPRNFMKKITEYLVILVAAPIFFTVVTSINSVLMSSRVNGLLTDYIGPLASFVVVVCKILSGLMIFGFFTFFYKFMPHTKVKFTSAFWAGLFTSISWFVVLMVYLKMQIGLAKFNTIYGTFAALPFFLAVVYASWSIILLGGEVGYAVQFHRFMRVDKSYEPMPSGACMLLGQVIMYEVCHAYAGKEGRWSPERFGITHGIPMRQLRYSVDVLLRARLLVQVADEFDDLFVPGCPPDLITLATVEDAFRDTQSVDGKQYFKLLPSSMASVMRNGYGHFLGELSEQNFEHFVMGEASHSEAKG